MGYPSQVCLWDLGGPEPRQGRLLSGPDHKTMSVRFTPDGRRLAGAGDNGQVRLWDTATGLEVLTLRGAGKPGTGHYGYIPRVAFSPDGRYLAANNWDGTVTVWDGGERGETASTSEPRAAQ
jgi:WD40 repeat protein